MHRSWATRVGAILLLLGTALLCGCKQKEGERCQLDSDCSDPLKCCLPPGSNARQIGGVCALESRCGAVDIGTTQEVGPKEAGLDKQSTQEFKLPDKSAFDQTHPPDGKADSKKADTKAPAPDKKTAP